MSYVSRMAILERLEEINEQHIGVVVFGRSPDYDSAADSIVRSHATRLRQKLEQYFRAEGSNESLRIDIPRGGYVPRFYKAESSVPEMLPLDVDQAPAEQSIAVDTGASQSVEVEKPTSAFKRIFGSKSLIVAFSVLLTLVIVVLLFLVRRHLSKDAEMADGRAGVHQTPIERRFWQTLLPTTGKTIIVSGDSSLTLFETVTNHEVSLEDYIDGAYRTPEYFKGLNSEIPPAIAIDIASRRYTSFVDEELTQNLTHLPEWTPAHVSNVFAQDLKPADAAASNLILIGSRQTNPWISLVEPPLNFVLVPDGMRGFQFLNRHPRDGEPKIYAYKNESGDFGEGNVYADIAYLPNPEGRGLVLILSGMWISSTQAAGQFILDSSQFSGWLQSIARPDGTIPPFELLLATKSLQGNATYTSIVAKRVMSASANLHK
ncbi:hypothetical protein [Acidicapsa ligni]|uniref:hypothetical protein n=1 Tax=Acidicapsa ligni TaxID=542300 RepID=UPI0021DF4710|nr:hypothetical protein [Acidicapsa ligni]